MRLSKLLLAIMLLLALPFTVFSQQPCDIIYVAPGTSNTNGLPNDPTNLAHAISLVSGNRQYIRMQEGIYNISNIINLTTNVKIEGGYRVNAQGDWVKRTDAITTLSMSGFEVANVGAPYNINVGHNIGFKAVGVNNWSLQDLTINVNGASGTTDNRGNSVYGVYIRNCSGYRISRCVVFSGAASQGSNGAGAAAGYDPVNDPYDGFSGANGDVGGGGDCDDDDLNDGNYSGPFGQQYNGNGGAGGNGGGTGFGQGAAATNFASRATAPSGATGSSATSFRAGGGGGAGGAGGSEARNGGNGGNGGAGGGSSVLNNFGNGGTLYGCGLSNSCGNDGTNGGVGAAGANGISGAVGPSGAVDIFFVPGGKGADGTDGAGGNGGGGAGGGGGQGGSFVTDGAGSGGGGGGGGGQGGAGGKGGFGGGSSYAIFIYNATGTIVDCATLAGSAGPGGFGGAGGQGGTGGLGAEGGLDNCGTSGDDEIGTGGRGGNGGAGGNGGNGGSGAPGQSIPVLDVQNGASQGTGVPSPALVTMNYANTSGCANSVITVTKGGGNWLLPTGGSFVNDLGPSSSSYTNSSATAEIAFSNAGIYNLGVNNGTLSNFVTITTSRALPIINANIPAVVCVGNALNLSSPSVEERYQWLIYPESAGPSSPVFTDTTQNPGATPAFTTPGNYLVRLRTYTTCCGWSVPVYASFVVADNPSVTASNDTTICNGSTVTLTANASGPGTYAWSTTQSGQSISVNPSATTKYFVTFTNASGCTATDSVLVTVSTLNVVLDSTRNVSCHGDSTGAAYVTVTGSNGPNTYTWSTGANTEDVTNLPAGTHTLTVANSLGCTATVQAVITQPNPLITSVSTLNNVACNGGNDGALDLTVTGGAGGYTYVWSNTFNGQDPSNLTAGTYFVTVTDANGCQAIDTGIVNQAVQINLTADITNVACFGGSSGSIALSVTGGSPSYTYNWSVAGGPNSPNLSNRPAGSYAVTVTDANGCTATGTYIIGSATDLSLQTSVVDASCANGSGGEVSVSVSGGTAPYTYAWNTTPGQNTATASGLVPGTYTVVVTDSNGCTKTASATVATSGGLELELTVSDVSCPGAGNGRATANIIGGSQPFTYTWSNNPSNPGAVNDGLSSGSYSLTVTDANSCSATQTFFVDEESEILVNLPFSEVNLEPGEEVDLEPDVNRTGDLIYTWTPSEGLSDPNSATVTADPQQTTTYTLTITIANSNCVGTDSVRVVVSNLYVVPDLFTPNGDGLNETFGIVRRSDVEVLEFEIYNRWGQQIFSSPVDEWDGTFEGEKQPAGIYVYRAIVILPDGTEEVLKGNITLIR